MNTQHADYLGKLLTTCWNIDRLRGRTLLSGIVHALIKSERPSEDFCGEPLPKMEILGDIAKIPLSGILCLDVPDWIKQYGINLTDADDIEEELEEALEDANVTTIVFDVDSPGGMALAGDKLFSLIEAANKKKPVMAYCADGRDMASSAYEAAAAATALYCGRYAVGIGCVGSYLAYLDDTQFWSQLGITFELFKSGEIKGIGESVPLNQAQKDFLQSTAAYHGGLFRANVRKYRTLIDPADLQGQWFGGINAAKRNFVSDNAPDLQTAIAKFRRLTRKAA
jgi:ClpP class serine protease